MKQQEDVSIYCPFWSFRSSVTSLIIIHILISQVFDNECWSLWWSHLLLKTFLIHSLMGYSNSISLFAWYLLLTADCNISIWLMIAYYAAGSTSSPVPWLAHSGRSSSKFGAKYYSGLRGFIMVQWIGPYGSGLFPKTVWPAKTFKWNLYLSYYCCSGWLL